MRYTVFFLTLIILFSPLAAKAQDGTEIVPVKDNLHMIVSPKGGNVLVSTGDDGTFLIDDQLEERSKIVTETIRQISDSPVQFILNTHFHFDHSGGNEAFGQEGAIIVAHDNVRKRLSTKQFITYFKRDMAPLSKAGLPVVTFSHDVTFHYNGEDIHIIHVPAAHTDGDSVAHLMKSNVIVGGDVVFNGLYPFIDVEHGGSVKGVIAALDTLLSLCNEKTVIVPGHGPLMAKNELQAYRNMLATIAGRIERAVKEGKTLEQTIASKPTREYDARMKQGIVGPDALVTMLFEDLAR